ncbi:hypothetical protein HGRIS_008066 [Hohenbuehelia grisea]|uniref:Uncharacterized protein n=1 Tax=Hohenbuehelia grisea TaxID=104357 RepID=A0ABR3J778_9AGAR
MSAPSFSSFPPSFSSFPDLDAGPSKPDNDKPTKSHRKSKHSSHHRDDDRDRRKDRRARDEDDDAGRDKERKRRKRDHDPHRKFKRRDEDVQPSKDEQDHHLSTASTNEQTGRPLFYSDRKGDPLNVTYGGLHAGDVPKYNFAARGRKVLGLSSHLSVYYRSGKGIEIGPKGSRKVLSLTDSKAKALLAAPPTRRIAYTGDHYQFTEVDGYLPLPSRTRRKDKPADRSIALADDHSDAETSASDDREGEDNVSSDSDGPPTTKLTALQETLQSLERTLTSDPASIPTWLSLLSHTLSTIPLTSKNATKARSEITLSILSRALHANESNTRSAVLRIKYLKAGHEIWSENMLQAEWEEALKVTGPGLWMEWLEWRIGQGSRGVNGVVEDSKRVLQALGVDEQAEIVKVRAFWRVAVALRDAGFSERAMAMFQAQSELAFEVPQDLYGLPLQHLLDSLEEFWESEVPRIGEVGAKGWSSWLAMGQPDHAPPPTSAALTPSSNVGQETDPYLTWHTRESHLDSLSILPTRSSSDSADADPYATIFFTDIRDLLIDLKSSRAKSILRLAWLSFLGLPFPGLPASLSSEDLESWDDRWSSTYLSSPSCLKSLFPQATTRITADAVAGALIGREREYSSVFGPVRSWSYDLVYPLDSLSSTTFGRLWAKEDLSEVDAALIKRLFEQLRLNGTDDFEWDALALAFEVTVNMKSALKQSRSFLSVARDSLPHWAAHAKLERRRDRLDDARKVYHTVLIASPPPNSSMYEPVQLWWDWAEMEWLAGRNEDAIQVVLKAAGVEGSGGMSVLRAKRALEDEVALHKFPEQWRFVHARIQLRALLELLAADIEAALAVFDRCLQHTSLVTPQDVLCEALTVASLLMTYRHGTVLKNPVPPSLLRERASKALEAYPSNSIAFAMFLEGERGQGVWGRIRGVLGDGGVAREEKDVARRVEEVWVAGWDKTRWESEVERTRNGLDGAVVAERTKGSAVIWRIYVAFEIRSGQLERAKQLLYRAIRECPLDKGLYLLAFGQLRNVFNASELKSLADTMAERQVRMRIDLHDILESWKTDERRAESAGSESDSEDEIEQRAKEYRRLLPF